MPIYQSIVVDDESNRCHVVVSLQRSCASKVPPVVAQCLDTSLDRNARESLEETRRIYSRDYTITSSSGLMNKLIRVRIVDSFVWVFPTVEETSWEVIPPRSRSSLRVRSVFRGNRSIRVRRGTRGEGFSSLDRAPCYRVLRGELQIDK